MSGLTGVGALITGVEIWLEHDRASFSNTMMWIPVAPHPGHGRGGGRPASSPVGRPRRSSPSSPWRWWRTAFRASTSTCAGQPSGLGACKLARYNLEMGPPTFAPLLFALVGGMGLLAAVLRRED